MSCKIDKVLKFLILYKLKISAFDCKIEKCKF